VRAVCEGSCRNADIIGAGISIVTVYSRNVACASSDVTCLRKAGVRVIASDGHELTLIFGKGRGSRITGISSAWIVIVTGNRGA